MQREIEFWFEFGSNYSYISVMRIEAAANAVNVRIAWKPFMLGPIFQSFGWTNSPFVLQKEKGAYVWNDMERECRKYGIPWTRPSAFPRLAVLPIRVALAGADRPWMAEFCRKIMTLNFVEDRDISAVEVSAQVLTAIGEDADRIIFEAQSEPNKLRLREQIEDARAKGIFGAPTFFAGGEMFWGNDRLDDALTYARGQSGD